MLDYFYLEEMEQKSLEYDNWVMGGFLGITPSSWLNEMGLFRQLDDHYLPKMQRVKHILGLEMHASTTSALNYLSIGDYDQKVVEDEDDINWIPTYSGSSWEVLTHSLMFTDTMIAQSDKGLRTRFEIEEPGILIAERHWDRLLQTINRSGNSNFECDEKGDFNYCYYHGNCQSPGLGAMDITLMSGEHLYIIKEHYLQQVNHPTLRCNLMLRAVDDDYMDELDLDLIIGQPLLLNYYSIFDVYNQRVGLYPAKYTIDPNDVPVGDEIVVTFFILIIGIASLVFLVRCRKKNHKDQVTVRPRSEQN